MKPLVTMLTKLSLSIMMNDVGVEKGNEVYDTVKEGVTGVISIDKTQYETEEEYVDAVSDSLDKTLNDHDIDLAPEIVDSMAKYVADNYSDLEEITDDEINDTILSYYEAYYNYVNGGGENPFPGILPDKDGEGDGGSSDVKPGGGNVDGLVCPGKDAEHTMDNCPAVYYDTVFPEGSDIGYDVYICGACGTPVVNLP